LQMVREITHPTCWINSLNRSICTGETTNDMSAILNPLLHKFADALIDRDPVGLS
jgi:hypothetical protein